MKATDKHSCVSGPHVLLRAAIDLGVVLSDPWQLWCGEAKCSSPQQARDSGGLAQAEADCGPGMECGGLSPKLWAFPAFLFSIFSAENACSEDWVIH